jgi:hypothetical protein
VHEPRISRPYFPEGYLSDPKTLLAWSYVEERLAEAKNYWLCSVDPGGKPQAVPVWAVWLEGSLYFDSSPDSRHARNIARNPNVAVHLENGDQALTGEGMAYMLTTLSPELGEKFGQVYAAKYAAWGYVPEPGQWKVGELFRVQFSKVLAWTDFGNDPTRFVFD